MSDTPETDIECFIYEGDYVPASFARKLERERDEARKEIKELKFELALTGIPTTVEEVEREEWRQERDALRAEVDQLKADKARLDWLEKRESMEGFTRDAIDSAMKGAE